MLTVICGEDNARSRQYFTQLKEELNEKITETRDITVSDLISLSDNSVQSLSLFSQKTVYFIENLDKNIGRLVKKGNPVVAALEKIRGAKDIDLYDWEDGKSAWDLKLKKIGIIKEFKPASSVFKLVESCYPGNLKIFLSSLEANLQYQEEQFLFIMLVRQIRLLILEKSDSLSVLPPWQRGKFHAQAKFWSEENLTKFYDGLYRIDVNSKTGGTPHNLTQSLQILACYFLK